MPIMDSTLLIKVKCGETLRRFSVHADENGVLDFDMFALRVKVYNFFNIASSSDLSLTYIDEDNDLVSLVDDDDLHEAIRQDLNPLRINVSTNSTKARKSKFRLRKSSSLKGLSGLKHSVSPIDSDAAEQVTKNVQVPLSNVLQLTMKAMSVLLTNLVECLSKLDVSHLGPFLQGQEGAMKGQKLISESPIGSKVMGDLEVEPNTCSSANIQELLKENFQKEKETEIMAAVLDNTVIPITAYSDIPKDSVDSECSNTSMIHQCNDLTDFKKPQEISKVHLCASSVDFIFGSSASPTDVPMPDSLQPPQASNTPLPHTVRKSSELIGDETKVSSSGLQLLSQSCATQSSKAWSYPRNFDSCLVDDVTIEDGTVIPPSTPCTKIWKVLNIGANPWPFETRLVWIGGDKLADQNAVRLEIPVDGFPVGKELDVAVTLMAPEFLGRYISYWRMQLPSGEQFGQSISVTIEVDSFPKVPVNTSSDFNLNFIQTPGARGKETTGTRGTDLDARCERGSRPFTRRRSRVSRGSISGTGLPISDPGLESLGTPSSTITLEQPMNDGGVADWDTMLEDLKDMGFREKVVNEKLLMKNGGNIKQTVMDLLAGKKA